MCEVDRIKLYWNELLPYVNVIGCGRNLLNRTGVLYEFFKESLAQCCGLNHTANGSCNAWNDNSSHTVASGSASAFASGGNGLELQLQLLSRQEKLHNQHEVLHAVHETSHAVGMPISLDAEFPYAPKEFVPVLETDGLFWVKVREPKHNAVALGSISTTGLPLLLVVITLTGYAAVILWLLNRDDFTLSNGRNSTNSGFQTSNVHRHRRHSGLLGRISRTIMVDYYSESRTGSNRSFIRGVFDSYWCAFVSATTTGYGDKVAQTNAGKMFTMVWIIFGITLVSTFTAIITTVMSSFLLPDTTSKKPFYDENIGVLEGSFDYLVLVKKSYPNTDSLVEALNNGTTYNIVMDKHAYWIYRAKIHQNQSFEFRMGVQNPTSIGYIYNTDNKSLLTCLKDYAVQNQVQVTLRLEALVKEAIASQPPSKVTDQVTLFFGPYTYSVIVGAVGILVAICAIGGILDYIFMKKNLKRRRKLTGNADTAIENKAAVYDAYDDGMLLDQNREDLKSGKRTNDDSWK